MTHLVLFDIDGTLLQTGGAGQASTRIALESVFGTSGNLSRFYPGGRTIDAILFDTLLDANIKPEIINTYRQLFYKEYIAAFERMIKSGSYTFRPYPGGPELISALGAKQGVLLGLLTGNHQKTAELKLKTAGYDLKQFTIGAYGNESTDRSTLVGLAKLRAFKQVGRTFADQDIVVIGDTARDVAGAKVAGVKSIGVATGTDNLQMLRSAHPDHLFADLMDTQAVLSAIFS
jgi:phosphoglycolate phosphatase